MKDDKITKVNSNFSENLRITSASNFPYKLCITNAHQFRKICPSSHSQRKNELLCCPDGHTCALLCSTILPSPFASSSFPGALTVFYCVKWNLMSNIQPDFLNESVYHVRPGALCFLQRRNCAEQSTYPLKQTGFTISCETTGSSSFSPVP